VSTHAFGQRLEPRATHRVPPQPSSRVPSFPLDWVEPRTFRRQKKGLNAHPFALMLDLLVMLSEPGPHLRGCNGRRALSGDQKQASLALLLQSSADPLQKLGGDGADRTPIHKTQRHLMAHRRSDRTVLPKHPIAGKGACRSGSCFCAYLFHQVDRFVLALPDIERGQSEAAPPHLIQKANDPAWLRTRPSYQPIACVFFNREWGSGLVIQCLARFQFFPNLLRARRTLSEDPRRGVSPCWKLIWAAKDNVHTLVSRPKSRGLRCSRSRSASNVTSGKVVRSRWGREEPSSKTASPAALKPWMMLSTVCLWHPKCLAIAVARSPRSDANRTFDRRKTKASLERKPTWIWLRSFSVKGRMNRGVFMPSIIPHCRSSFVSLH
jgi:hypothetical protein